MPFDKPTRNLLAKMVAACRKRLADDVESQLQSTYGLYPDGTVLDVARTADERHAAADLLALWRHLEASEAGSAKERKRNAWQRLVREIGFTLLNRLAALRLCEERDLVIECVRRGMESDGFQLFDRMANGSLGNRYATYRAFLDGMVAELALDLGVLFDRSDPRGLIFPGEAALADLLAELNHPDLAARGIWQQDETIGWIYQYYNDPAERKQMRDASQAPRNSRELAVRNQFFTPRYVVEFLTDNTLGRIWYEMTEGRTQLTERCRYLVRRPVEIFLSAEYVHMAEESDWQVLEAVMHSDFSELPTDTDWGFLNFLALLIDGYDLAPRLGLGDCGDFANARMADYRATGRWHGSSVELWICLFLEQRRWHHFGDSPTGPAWDAIHALYQALRAALLAECDASNVTQAELLRQPVYIAPRAKKDPRTITMLDPAGGSGHFGLYCFDLYEVIYAEAYDDPELGPALQAEFPDRTAYLLEVPRLILAHNIHIIDIDPRACQIAALALWLRAQRAWQQMSVPAARRPQITRSNVVTAEPMPGDRALLDEFVATLDPPVLGDLVRVVFDKMQLAGEAGSLLKIEEELSEAIARARAQWEASRAVRQAALLPDVMREPPRQGELFDVSNIDDAAFWERAEGLVLAELARYAGQHDLRHRLFAGDAARGFAFIDVCREHYDVVLMNPPFGAMRRDIQLLLEEKGYHSRDLAADFITNAIGFLAVDGLIGAITTRTIYYLKGFADWRDLLIDECGGPRCFLDIGFGVLDAAVEAIALTIDIQGRGAIGTYVAALGHHEQLEVGGPSEFWTYPQFYVHAESFLNIPRHPFAYWASEKILNAFARLPSIGSEYDVLSGGNPRDDFRFVRHWVETQGVNPGDFVPYSKGGEFRLYYHDVHLTLNWKGRGEELKVQAAEYRRALGWSPDWRALIMNYEHYFKPGITWPRRTSRLSFRFLPEGCVFGDKSPVLLARQKDLGPLYSLIAYLNSSGFHQTLSLMVGSSELAQSFEVGIVKSCPLPEYDVRILGLHSIEIYRAMHTMDSVNEDSHAFVAPFLPADLGRTLFDLYRQLIAKQTTLRDRVLDLQREIDKYSASALGFDSSSPRISTEDFGELTLDWWACFVTSYLIGCVFGRWDIRYTTGEKPAPALPDPFAPLPACPPGMLQNGQGLPAAPEDVPADYPLRIAWDGILVDDPGLGDPPEPHDADIVRRVREALAVLWPETHDSIEAEACEILGVRELRDYFRKPGGFFGDHLKRYSKSRRQAPIYWPLSTASGRYTVWLYYHRLTGETLYTVVNRYVEPKLGEVERALAAAEAGMGQVSGREATRLREQADDLRAFRAELDAFRTELLRVAGLPYRPNLDDGVIINAAPLQRLFGLRKWAKDTEAVWRKLEAGEYDWAHLAYTIWPARVQEVCRRDRSIAIAHGLEELCEVTVKAKKGKKSAPAETEEIDFEEEQDEQGTILEM